MIVLPSPRLGLLGALLLGVAACNKDDSDGADTSGDTDSVGDVTAPSVVSSSPFDGEVDVPSNHVIVVLFDEALDAASVTSSSFTVTADGALVAGTVTAVDRTATFTPTDDLVASTQFEAEITTGVTDLAGNALDAAYVWNFTTGVSADTTAPQLLSTSPWHTETDVTLTHRVSLYFDEALDPATISSATLHVSTGGERVDGTITLDGSVARFTPAGLLAMDTVYDASITADVRDLAGNALAEGYAWTFTTGHETPGLPVDLGTAANFAILAKTAISTVPASAIVGDIGLSPAAASYITGFSLTEDSSGAFATSTQVTGKVYASDYEVPTPITMTTAIGDMELAFTSAAGRAADYTEIGAGDIGGKTLAPGVYKWGTGVLIPTDVTLDGSATDVWVFQIAQDLTMSSGARVHLSGGALPENVFWQVAGRVELGTTAHAEGILLSQTSVTLATGATVNGRLLAQSAVVLDTSTVVAP